MLEVSTGELIERRVNHTGKEVEAFYRDLRGGAVVGLESTGYTVWFHEQLEAWQIELKVGDAAKIRAQQVRKKKNDCEDARLLLKLLVEERFPQIWVIDPEGRDVRYLLAQRTRLVRTRTRVKNALQALALNHRLALGPGLFSRRGRGQLQALAMRPFAAHTREELLQWLEWLDERLGQLDGKIREEAQAREACRRLMSYPGVGALTALAYVLIIGPPQRFASAAQVAGYLGLIPAEFSSAARVKRGRISKQGSRLLRHLMTEAGHSACRHEPQLRQAYRRILKRRGRGIAKVAIARKLSEHLYILLRDGMDYPEFRRRGVSMRRACPSS